MTGDEQERTWSTQANRNEHRNCVAVCDISNITWNRYKNRVTKSVFTFIPVRVVKLLLKSKKKSILYLILLFKKYFLGRDVLKTVTVAKYFNRKKAKVMS